MASAVFFSLIASPLSYAGAFRGRIKRVISSAFSTTARFIKNVIWRNGMPLSLSLR
jgi:hypothetical protein